MRTEYFTDRIEITDCRSMFAMEELKREVREGLSQKQKSLPCKYFYDSRGSALFERISLLPEYYQTRTEIAILKQAARSLMDGFKEGSLVELGSGSNRKARCLLDAANGGARNIRYVPVDVCESAIIGSAEELLCLYPDLTVSGYVADFNSDLDGIGQHGDKLITFFGGTIGNLSDHQRSLFLKKLAAVMTTRDRLIVGLDMVKKKELLEAAYNDDQHITAEFNKNILSVINRELNASFDERSFDHLAFYNEKSECIEMHLQANEPVNVEVADIDFSCTMHAGETIFTEMSRKFRKESVREIAAEAGFRIHRWFTDRRGLFALAEMKKTPNTVRRSTRAS